MTALGHGEEEQAPTPLIALGGDVNNRHPEVHGLGAFSYGRASVSGCQSQSRQARGTRPHITVF
jgi:hypothetical protein